MKTTVTETPLDEPAAWITFFQIYGAYLAFPVALTAMMGSLYYSEIVGYLPCKLCWIQRILMYPLTIITLVGILKDDEYLPTYVLPFSVLGMCISTYHYLLQMKVITTNSCGDLTCSSIEVSYLGFITIPFMALTAFIMITVIMSLTQWAYAQMEEEE